MKKIVATAAITVLFSTMATANSGLADRISDARSYPNKTVGVKSTQMDCIEKNHKNKHGNKSDTTIERNDSGNSNLNHDHF